MTSADYEATRRAVSYYLIPPGPKYLPQHPILENLQTTSITIIHLPCIFYYFVLCPTTAQLSHKLSHFYVFRHYRVILREN